jgi:hypothetical protein
MTLQVDRFCFCKKGLMSICTADSIDKQKKCIFYQKSSNSDKCMYFIFNKYCDCVEAQMTSEKQGAPDVL